MLSPGSKARRSVAALAAGLAVLGLSGCGQPAGRKAGGASPRTRPTPTARRPAISLPPSGETLVAYANGPAVAVYGSPGAPAPQLTMPNPWFLNGVPQDPIRQAFLVVGSQNGWTEIELPQRPNGSRGWLAPGSVDLLADPWRITVSLQDHRITVTDRGSALYAGPVAVGAPATPTPTGTHYIRVLLHTTNPSSVYGPYAYGLSAHSETLTSFDGGDAEIGIHGNNDTSVLGESVTHGCVRMDNAEITKLASLIPLGTPVDIRP